MSSLCRPIERPCDNAVGRVGIAAEAVDLASRNQSPIFWLPFGERWRSAHVALVAARDRGRICIEHEQPKGRSYSPSMVLAMTSSAVLYWLKACCCWPVRRSRLPGRTVRENVWGPVHGIVVRRHRCTSCCCTEPCRLRTTGWSTLRRRCTLRPQSVRTKEWSRGAIAIAGSR